MSGKVVLHIEVDLFDADDIARLLDEYREIFNEEATVYDLLEHDEWIVDSHQIVVGFRVGDGDNEPVQVATVGRLVGAKIPGVPAPITGGRS